MKLKKILALLLAAMMVLGMTSAMADTKPVISDGKGENGAATTNSDTLAIDKTIIIHNDLTDEVAGVNIAYPAVDFTFNIKPKTPEVGASVTDKDGDKADVKQGPDNGIVITNTNNKVSFAKSTVTLNKNGEQMVQSQLNLRTDLQKFTAAGVYRYEITDTTNVTNGSDFQKAGMVRGANYDPSYILDVYIKNNSNGDGFEIAGYVLTKDEVKEITKDTEKDSGIDQVTITTTTTYDPQTQKPTTTKTLDDTTPVNGALNDMYYTYNVEVTKTVTGAMGDMKNEFPFTFAVSDNQDLQYVVRDTDDTEKNKALSNGTAVTLSNGDTVTIIGLNPHAKINWTEKQNLNGAVYKVSAKDKGTAADKSLITETKEGTTTQFAMKAYNETAAAYSENQAIITEFKAAEKATLSNASKVDYTNNMDEVSPTGVVLRFAPYIAMLVAGTALFLILLAKRREEDKEEN